MDTGEFLVPDYSFSEANKKYTRLLGKLRRTGKAMIEHTTAIHKTYHKRKKCEWHNCNMAICRHTQLVVEYEGLEIE